MGPFKHEYDAAPPEEEQLRQGYRDDPPLSGKEIDARIDPRNPAYAYPKNENRVPNADMLEEIIREEIEAVLAEEESFQDMSRTADEMFAADAKVVKRAVVRGPDGEEVELKRTAGMSNEEWENAKRVAMGGSPKKKLSMRQRHNKEQDRRYAIHKARKARDQERASMYAGADEPQFEQIVREELEAVLTEKAQSESWEF